MDSISILLKDINNGNQQSFESLKAKYSPLLTKEVSSFLFTGSGSKEDLEYIAENALLNAAVTYDQSKNIAFGYYAKVCIRNALKSAYRSALSERKQKNKTAVVNKIKKPISIPAFSDLSEDEIKSKIDSVLSPYEILILEKHLEGLKPREIAVDIGKDTKSVSNAIFRIREKIKNIK